MVKFFHRSVTVFYIELDSREMKRTLQVLNLLLFFSVSIGMQHNDYNVNLHFCSPYLYKDFSEYLSFKFYNILKIFE